MLAPDRQASEGIELYYDGRYEEASSAFRATLSRYPEKPEVLFNLGVSLIEQAQSVSSRKERDRLLQESASLFDRVNEIGPRSLRSRSLYNLGNVRFLQGQVESSIDAYQEAMRAGLSSLDVRYNLELAMRERLAKSGLAQDEPEPSELSSDSAQMFPEVTDIDRKLNALERRSHMLF